MELQGTFMKLGVRNGNGHIYTSESLKTAFEDYQKKVADGNAFGTIIDVNHPSNAFDSDRRLSEISHRVTEVEWNNDSNEITGKIELYDTPDGNIAEKFLEVNGELDIAPSTIGELKEDGTVYVSEIISFDICLESAFEEAKIYPVLKTK